MREFDPKKPTSKYLYSIGFSKFMGDGVTLDDSIVDIAVYDFSAENDSDPSAMLVGSPFVNGSAVTIEGTVHPPGSVVMQAIEGGVLDCDYVTSFRAVLSDGQQPSEDVLLKIRKYEPR